MTKICIDPGHGGRDPGACGNGLKESHCVLAISLELERLLKELGYHVDMTRREDANITLNQRADFAGAMQSDFFVSIHANAAAHPSAHGFEIYHYPRSTQGWHLAHAIHAECVQLPQLCDRGIKPARFFVLKHTPCPAVLVEMVFITNPLDSRYLCRPEGHFQMAEAIARGIHAYVTG